MNQGSGATPDHSIHPARGNRAISSGAGHVRISLGMDDGLLIEAARRIRRFADALA